ncbi:hypothetical protein ACHQM5_002525 [Ranunculus cassubicifolius]
MRWSPSCELVDTPINFTADTPTMPPTMQQHHRHDSLTRPPTLAIPTFDSDLANHDEIGGNSKEQNR